MPGSGALPFPPALRLALAALALALPAAAADPAAPDLTSCAAIAEDAPRLACYDRLAGREPSVAPAPAAGASSDFGREPKPQPTGPESITARIVGTFKEWQPGMRFSLDNGQVWKVEAGERGYYPDVPDNAEVTVRRSFFGAYWMEIHAIGRRVKVRRVK